MIWDLADYSGFAASDLFKLLSIFPISSVFASKPTTLV